MEGGTGFFANAWKSLDEARLFQKEFDGEWICQLEAEASFCGDMSLLLFISKVDQLNCCSTPGMCAIQ
jgi:hypothetical protein